MGEVAAEKHVKYTIFLEKVCLSFIYFLFLSTLVTLFTLLPLQMKKEKMENDRYQMEEGKLREEKEEGKGKLRVILANDDEIKRTKFLSFKKLSKTHFGVWDWVCYTNLLYPFIHTLRL